MKTFVIVIVIFYTLSFIAALVNMASGFTPQFTPTMRALDILIAVVFMVWGAALLGKGD